VTTAALAILVELLMQMQALENKLARRCHQARRLERPEQRDDLAQSGHLAQRFHIFRRRRAVRNLDAPALLEVARHFLQVVELQILVEDF
jgi:hypothetical protein